MLATCRAHPIRTAAILGALLGVLNALVLETQGILHHRTSGVLSLLAPFSPVGLQPSEPIIMQAVLILFIEFAANILADALLFAAPVALIVLFLRVLRTLRR